jgi:predicted metal-dependent hydrolase
MTSLQLRRVPFAFDDDVPFQWQPTNPEFGLMAVAVGVLAIAFEKFIVASLRQAMPLITDPGVRAEAEAFLRQEAQHAKAHRLHMRAIVKTHPGLQRTVDAAVASFDELHATRPIKYQLAYTANLEATFTPTFKLMLDHDDVLFEPGDDRVASLFLWHFVEEVEHRSSAMTIYRSVFDDELYRLRVVPGVFRHVLRVYRDAMLSFNEAVPESERIVDARRVTPRGTAWRETAVRIPGLRRRALAHGHPTPFQSAGRVELIRTYVRLVLSLAPGHDPEHAATPKLADTWFERYDEGADVTHWYTRAAVGA